MVILRKGKLVGARPFFARSIFEQVDALMRDLDRPARHLSAPTVRPVFARASLVEDGDGYLLRVALPGVDPGDVSVQAVEAGLKVSARRKLEVPEGSKALRLERTSSDLTRTFSFPREIDSAGVEAAFVEGLLEVRVPLSASAQPRKIEIKVA